MALGALPRLAWSTSDSRKAGAVRLLPTAAAAHHCSRACRYNEVNGIPSCANAELLTTLARSQWAFDGYVTGDCGAVDDVYVAHPSVFIAVPPPPLSLTRIHTLSCTLTHTHTHKVWSCPRCGYPQGRTLPLLVCLCSFNAHKYTNSTSATCAAVLEAGLVRYPIASFQCPCAHSNSFDVHNSNCVPLIHDI
jgi:hypothetical protein